MKNILTLLGIVAGGIVLLELVRPGSVFLARRSIAVSPRDDWPGIATCPPGQMLVGGKCVLAPYATTVPFGSNRIDL